MSEERRKILELLASGKINTDEAERLLAAVESTEVETPGNDSVIRKKPKFLHVKVEQAQKVSGSNKNVDIKIPLLLLKAGVKLRSLMPDDTTDKISTKLNEKGIMLDLNNINSKEIDLLTNTLTEGSIDIDTEKEKVKIYCT